jgi:hypothetical protein
VEFLHILHVSGEEQVVRCSLSYLNGSLTRRAKDQSAAANTLITSAIEFLKARKSQKIIESNLFMMFQYFNLSRDIVKILLNV